MLVWINLFLLICTVTSNNDTILTSAYAKVAKWGMQHFVKPDLSEGRSSSGQSFFSQRSDAHVRTGQNIKPKEIVYHYSMNTNSKVGLDSNDQIPGKGEVVLQDRFNPPPLSLFDKSKNNHESKPSIVYSSSATSFDSPQTVDAKPSYDSPITSYGPVASGLPSNVKEVDTKPSMGLYDSPISSYNPAPSGLPGGIMDSSNEGGYSYNPPKTKFPGYTYDPPKSDVMPDNSYEPPKSNKKPKFPGYVYDPPMPNIKPDDMPNYSYKPPKSDKKPGYIYHPPMPNSKPDNMPDFSYEPPKPNKNPKIPSYTYGGPPNEKPIMMNYAGPYAPVDNGDDNMPPSGEDDAKHNYLPMDEDNGSKHHYMPDDLKHGFKHHHHMQIDDDQGPPLTATVGPPVDDSYMGHHHMQMDDGNQGPPITATVGPPVDDSYMGHHHMQMGDDNQGPPITATAGSPIDDSYMDHHHHHHDHKHGDDADLSPPPSQNGFPKQIPEYLDHDPSGHYPYNLGYNFDENHHHVYHEVTTTTEAPEDERVNKGHYSYYYLGRKLWYVPLYFSVYFILYITALILKSIARHKVNFVHTYPDKTNKRSLDLDETTEKVNSAIDNFNERYLAM